MQRRRRNSATSSSVLRKSRRPNSAIPAKLLLIFFLSGLLIILLHFQRSKIYRNQPKKEIGERFGAHSDLHGFTAGVEKILLKYYVPEKWVTGMNRLARSSESIQGDIHLRIDYPPLFSVHEVIFSILRQARGAGLRVFESYERISPNLIGLGIASSSGHTIHVEFRENNELIWYSKEVAVVIDDFGYTLDEGVQNFLNLPFPITFAIIPGTQYAHEIARKASQAGFEVLIHLPMEPLHSKVENNGFTIFSRMSEKQMDRIVTLALGEIPEAIGINNHMGSRATADPVTMARLMQVLKRHHLFFLDSQTTRKSVAFRVAKESGIPALKLTTYLDNPGSSSTVEQKLRQVIEKSNGSKPAVVIGHARKETANLLGKELPFWAYHGVRFVGMKEMLENL